MILVPGLTMWPLCFRIYLREMIPWSQSLSFILSWQIWQTSSFISFLWAQSAESLEKKASGKDCWPGILTFMASAFDRRFWLEDVFNCSTSHMIGWIKYLWGCDWSKENDIFDSCQVLSQLHESEIVNDLDQRLSFLLALRSAFHVSNFQIKKDNIKRKPLGPG